ncbi:MAG: hypothetical protein WC998_04265 [Candidatus Paceibacterota bacterium]|jgi:hypothetical protein
MADHESCIIDIVEELMNKNFTCYVEYEISVPISLQEIYERKKVIVDVFALKKEKQVLIEVGLLSQSSIWAGRIELLKKVMPNAQVLWVTQWKNFISPAEFENARLRWRYYDPELAEKNKRIEQLLNQYLNKKLVPQPSDIDLLSKALIAKQGRD